MNPSALAKLKIVLYPDPVLHRKCAQVENFGDELQALVDRMFELMRTANGVGLAAPQVGESRRLFICNITGEPGDDQVFVNPRLTSLEGVEVGEEGCLSIPGVTVEMRRSKSLVLDAQDIEGSPIRKTACGLEARVWQHECDHLDGRLITDNMSSTDAIANRRALKQLEADFASARKSRKMRT